MGHKVYPVVDRSGFASADQGFDPRDPRSLEVRARLVEMGGQQARERRGATDASVLRADQSPQFQAPRSAHLRSVLSDEFGTGRHLAESGHKDPARRRASRVQLRSATGNQIYDQSADLERFD